MFEIAIILIVVAMVVGFYAQHRVSTAFKEYSNIRTTSNLTGAQVAHEILRAAQISDVEVVEINGMLGDHYDPKSKRLCLSSETYNTPSVSAAGIAAHETGHAIQHARAYAPLELRMTIVPVTQIVSQALPFIIFGGMFLRFLPWTLAIQLGAICYGVLTVFQLITLPVEFDATRRAKIILQQMGIIQPGAETEGVNKVLDAAALTYVAAFVGALGNLLLMLSYSQRRN
ncbi:MAG TPA: zinc metallopeptidase [Chthoniobacteraceae bacterium]|nr:zinc metallopeptidase [Chthoniobacteraceae bacterium]